MSLIAAALSPLTRNQKFLLAGIFALGFGLRIAGIGSHSLSHYDEGVYVYNGIQAAFGDPLHFNFDQPLHAPPLFPWLIGLVCWLSQTPWPAAGQLVSAAAGTATLPVVFLLARRLGGNQVGLLAMALLAMSDLHIAFSRMALTDVLLTFWFTLAIYFAVRAGEVASTPDGIAGRSAKWLLLFTIATACAWNTKYNGWMPPVIAIAAIVLVAGRQQLRLKTDSESLVAPLRLGTLFFIAFLLAGVCYVPWYLFVESNFPGGYQAITDHHRTYVGGPSEWPQNALHLMHAMSGYRHRGWLLLCGCAIAGSVALFASERVRARVAPTHRLFFFLVAFGSIASMIVIGSDATLLIIACLAMVPALIYGRFAEVVVAVWVGAFLILLPFYHPYTRLLLPVTVASTCLVANCVVRSGLIERVVAERSAHGVSETASSRLALGLALIGCATIAVTGCPFGVVPSADLWNRWSTDFSYQSVTEAFLEVTEPDAFVICQAQPTLSIYVPRERLPIGNVPFSQVLDQIPADRVCYLAVDFFWLHSQPDGDALAGILSNRARLRPVATIPNDLNLVTLGNFLTPRQIAQKVRHDRRPEAGSDPIPPALDDFHRDIITIFAIDRN